MLGHLKVNSFFVKLWWFKHAFTNCDASYEIFCELGSINSAVTKFVTFSLEKSKGLMFSLKYSKRVSIAILSGLFADGENLRCITANSKLPKELMCRCIKFDVQSSLSSLIRLHIQTCSFFREIPMILEGPVVSLLYFFSSVISIPFPQAQILHETIENIWISTFQCQTIFKIQWTPFASIFFC